MHLLYLDDSGSVTNASDQHIVLAGLAVFERQPHWFASEMDEIAKRIWPDNFRHLEFRGSDILSGKKHWRGVGKDERLQAYKDALGILQISSHVTIFGAVIHKAALSPDDPMEYAFEQLCNRFDRFLGRLHKAGNTQRGLIILDKSSYETSLQGLSVNFRSVGHRWGQIYNLADVPMFVDSKATRLIQYADLVAHAIRRSYEKADQTLFDIIAHKFDTVGGVVHGLVHFAPAASKCGCLHCKQRRTS
jgi:hypothetical protein